VRCFYCGVETTGAKVVRADGGKWACREVGPCLDRERSIGRRR
jgi:phosphoglucomutase